MSKVDDLKKMLKDMNSVAVAFSGGVDSTYLLKVAHDVLDGKCIAVTALSPSFPDSENDEARKFCESEGIKQFFITPEEYKVEEYAVNPPNRCYVCKHILFKSMIDIAKENGIDYVLEGTNLDDEGDYRPGMKAIEELGVRSPLREAGFTKDEIRRESNLLDLPTWDKPSFACLASRFPYGTRITKEGLLKVGKAEEVLKSLGFKQCRVRYHDDVARVEVLPDDIIKLVSGNVRRQVSEGIKAAGFRYVAIDIDGYRTGSLNEGITGV